MSATDLPLAQRLMESAKAWLTTAISAGVDPTGALETARQLVAGVAPRRQDEDSVITPQADADKKIRVILSATDEGQIAPQVQVIRKLRLEFHVRGNALVNNGLSEPFIAMCGAVEKLLDGMNMKVQLTSSTWAIAVMKAPRAPGVSRQVEGNIRTHIYALDIAAVGTEHTTS
jgi:hypothetical protein